jgi:hypothetical protein
VTSLPLSEHAAVCGDSAAGEHVGRRETGGERRLTEVADVVVPAGAHGAGPSVYARA